MFLYSALVCVTESELLQWQARGLMHLAADRVSTPGMARSSLFALAPLAKLDDAKARIVVNLGGHFSKENATHPGFNNSSILSISWDQIFSIAPVLPQFRRRLDSFKVPVENFDVSDLWNEWLIIQSCHERAHFIKCALKNAGPSDTGLVFDALPIEAMIRIAVRPHDESQASILVPRGWRVLLQNRDAILSKLRFDGHSDRPSFLEASISELIEVNGSDPGGFTLKELVEKRDTGWNSKDLSRSTVGAITSICGEAPFSMDDKVSLLFGAIYLRIFDELFYGQKDWELVLDLVRFARHYLDAGHADHLACFVAAAFPAEVLRSLDLRTLFAR
jgi:hypothetical protein